MKETRVFLARFREPTDAVSRYGKIYITHSGAEPPNIGNILPRR